MARGRDDPVPVRELAGARDDASLDQVDEPVCEQLGVHTEVGVVAQQAEHLVRDSTPIPACNVAPSGMRSATYSGEPAVCLAASGGVGSSDQRDSRPRTSPRPG